MRAVPMPPPASQQPTGAQPPPPFPPGRGRSCPALSRNGGGWLLGCLGYSKKASGLGLFPLRKHVSLKKRNSKLLGASWSRSATQNPEQRLHHRIYSSAFCSQSIARQKSELQNLPFAFPDTS